MQLIRSRGLSSADPRLPQAADHPRSLFHLLYPLWVAAVVVAYILLPIDIGILVLLVAIVLFAWTAGAE